MSFFDRAKQVAGQAADKAKEGLEEIQTRRQLDESYEELGKRFGFDGALGAAIQGP